MSDIAETAHPLPTALAGIRVLELATLYAAPLIGTNLADFGADVIKVEHPRGDALRSWGLSKDGVPLWWKAVSRNKRLVSLDLNDPVDRAVVRRLADQVDILIENFRPGRMESWGLAYEALAESNPKLIMVRVTGFGQTGPYRNRPGFGTLAEAFSGFAFVTGDPEGPPTLPAFGLADGVAGFAGTFATLAALYWRDTQVAGTGQVVDLSLYEPLFSILSPMLVEYAALGVVQKRTGNRSPRTAPRNAYQTADGHWVALSAGTQQIANRIFAAIERPELTEDPRFSDALSRRAHADEIDNIVADWMGQQSLEVVLKRFEQYEAPIAPVSDAAQIASDPHYRARGSFLEVQDPDLGTVTMPNIVPRLSRTPGRIRHAGRLVIGSDTAAVIAQLGGDDVVGERSTST